jgi:hypothetical protein
MAFSAIAEVRRFMDAQRKFDVEADCSKCQRRRPCWSRDKPGFYVCAECLADLEAEKITNLQVASYGKFVDEAVIGIRSRDERAIILALNAATDVWDRLIAASPRHTALIAAMEMQFANRVLLREFEVEDATQKFSAGLRRHMKRERKIFDECHAMVGTPKS